jgi:hypothetical protein
VVKIWNPGKGKHLQCLVDLDETLKSKHGRTYRYKAANGKRVSVTVPACACAPEMPGNAKCVCNTVAGNREGGGCFVHVYYHPN